MAYNLLIKKREPRMIDRVLIRNYSLFFATLVFCAGGLIYILIAGDREIGKTDAMVAHTQSVITEAEKLATLVEGMLSSQRGYIISNQQHFLDEYETKRDKISEHIASLTELTSDNHSQASRMVEIRSHFIEFSTRLEERAQKYTPIPPDTKIILDDVQSINGLKENIIRINQSVLDEEYQLLQDRIKELERKKSKYFSTLLIAVVLASAMLMLFNGFLLAAQRLRNSAEAHLKDTEQRFALAIEGTQDGIFDWNIITGEVFFSKRYFEMLGYDRVSFIGRREDASVLIHPEDAARVEENLQKSLSNQGSEYAQEFRMKNSDGRWMWVQSRAKVVFDAQGHARRMIGAHTDISHLKEHQEHMKAEKERAEAANRAKSDFLAHMSHEIRTPLTAISGIGEILQKNEDELIDKHKKLVKTLNSSTSALKDLINDILDFSKIEAGDLDLDMATFKLGHVFEEVISMMSVRANAKHVSFLFDYTPVKNIDFYGDKMRLRQILVNLIGNALKFTDQGAVTVKAFIDNVDDSPFLRVDVVDTGIERLDLTLGSFIVVVVVV